MLLAEALVLLALAPDGRLARGTSNQPAVSTGVTGALVTELALAGHLLLDDGRMRLTGTRPEDPFLAGVLGEVARHEGKRLRSRLGSIRNAGWPEVVDHMMARGLVGHETAFLRPTRHPVLDPALHAEVRARMRAAATGTQPLDRWTEALLALAGPSQLLEVVAPDRSDRRHARRRIKEAGRNVPAADAVQRVVNARRTAASAGASGGATAATASS